MVYKILALYLLVLGLFVTGGMGRVTEPCARSQGTMTCRVATKLVFTDLLMQEHPDHPAHTTRGPVYRPSGVLASTRVQDCSNHPSPATEAVEERGTATGKTLRSSEDRTARSVVSEPHCVLCRPVFCLLRFLQSSLDLSPCTWGLPIGNRKTAAAIFFPLIPKILGSLP